MSDSLRPHGLQQARPPCPSPTPIACSNSCPLSGMPSNHLILCCPLLLLPTVFPSIRVFSSESVLHIKWPKYWSFSFNISPSNEHPGVTSFRMDWLDLLAVPGTVLHWADTSPSPLAPPSRPAAPGQRQGAQFGPLLLTALFIPCRALLESSPSKSYSDTSVNRCSSLKHYYIY